ncbi:cell surface protein SprA [Flavobacterium sp.]|uniref:T9SS outer membrane translocon Sov/SprA n=1 Tax=Flavobacterium sp. TaxID=239 RepID=UPI00375103EB
MMLVGQLSVAQVTPTPTTAPIPTTTPVQVTDSTGYNTGSIKLENPKSVVEAYTYDPTTNMYVLTKTFEGFNINYPIILTPKEYEQLVLRESMHDYFKKKSDAIEGKKEGAEEAKRDLLPKYYVNSSFFETIFGGNTIDVKPTGSVEIDLGFRHTKQDNPSFSPRNRATTTFDFDQRISMSLMGKVGTRLNVNANYDTQSTFAFQNLIKLEFDPTAKGGEDSIIQKIEVGNVSMPLNSSLIRGAQSLFGVKAQLQFGKTTVTGVFSEQKSQTKSITSQGGGTIQNFELFAQEYDADRHFFLSQYFKNKYDTSLRNYPLIDSRVQITRIEVWITNKQNRVSTTSNNLRNIIALQDLGEASLTDNRTSTPIPNSEVVAIDPISNPANSFFLAPQDTPSKNSNNKYDPNLITTGGGYLNPNIREIVTSNSGFNNLAPVSEGTDYAKLENARKLSPNEFTFHPQLGYISLQQRLANDEVLAVAYQYTIGDQVYQVGEFGTDGVDATQVDPNGIPSSKALILKMLKSSLTNVQKPIWGLMMKNIYQIQGGYQLQKEDFKFNILYTDPSPLNYITQATSTSPLPADVEQAPLLNVFNVDKLNYNNDPQNGGDGFFDFIPGLTVDQQNGRLIFTKVEPFGKYLFDKLRTSPTENYNGDPLTPDYNANQAKYVFRSLYKSTQAAALQDSGKNKFQLRGKFKSSGGDGIPIGAFNVPKGSVVVTAGGRVLVEGIDYTVNYQAGRVQILDPALSASNTPIEVSVENNSVFGQQTRRFFGVNVEHKFSDKFLLGATFLKMSERPFTQKSNYGQESVNNSIYGLNTSYSTEVPFLTRLVNKLPNIDTDVPSVVSFRGEVAYLKPNSPKTDKFQGESTIYVDDFEGSQTTIDLKSPFSWYLSATPERPTTGPAAFYNDFGGTSNTISYGFKRAKLAWYSIDPVFYTQRPTGISDSDLSYNSTRRIYSQELYPNTVIAQGQSQVVNTLDLTFFPKERGPFNFNPATAPDETLPNPTDNFGGIVRALNSTNFEQANVEYIQFWMLDPYFDPGNVSAQANSTNTGKIYFNLGEISEDVLKDGRKFYENGVGTNQVVVAPQGIWGDVPASQSLIYAFDSNQNNRTAQDLGYNGINDSQEAAKFPAFASFGDPAADNYKYFLNTTGDVFQRYKNYNGTEGNSPIDVTDTNRGSSTVPDVEDINRDNTMNTINAYYEYSIDVSPSALALTNVGNNYITDVRETTVTLPNGDNTSARWIQFKIPVSQPTNTIGSISDFRSIRFMRMFMTGFKEQITTRFGSLDLVRGEWRRYENTLDVNDTDPSDDSTDFDVIALNIQENGDRTPIKYVTPPGVELEQLYYNNTLIPQNEQALALRATGSGLEPGDSRAVFKNVSVDMRQFKKLKMFLHAEALPNDPDPLVDDEMVGFIRFGNDFTDNFYQVEMPLKVTQVGGVTPESVWPEENFMNVSLELITRMKILALNHVYTPGEIYYPDDDVAVVDGDGDPKLHLGIRGNPNFGLVRTIMLGIKNQTNVLNTTQHPLLPKRIKGEAWFNEMRLAEMDNKGGMAAVANMDANLADFANVSATGRLSTIGFGTLEQGPNERSREDVLQYNVVTNMSLGKLLPKKWGVNLPFNYAIGEEFITPKYDPFNQDIELKQLIDVTADDAEKRNLKNRAIDYTKRKSINFIGVKKERGEKQKQHFYDPENLTLSYSYNQVDRHNYELENYTDQQVNTTADYTFAFQPKPLEPFKKVKTFKKSSYWKLLSDFNFNYLPTNVSFSSNITRQFNKQQFRLVDVEGIGLDALYQRNFLFNYQYGFNYNLTKALKINFSATSNNIVRNYLDENNDPDNSYTIWTDYWNIGSSNLHNQQITVNYDLPINKIPFLSFVKSAYTYTGNYSWQRSSLALSSITDLNGMEYNLGNTIQNSGAHKLNTQFNMDTFYKYIGLVKSKKTTKTLQTVPPKPGDKVAAVKATPAKDANVFLDGLIGIVTSVKNLQINYIENQGTALPGFLPRVGFFGTAKPSLGFAFGGQDDVRFEAAKNGWLTSYPEFNQNYTQVLTRTLEFTANLDLFPDFKIDLNANRTYANNYSEQYDVTNGQYNSRSPYDTGNFAISTVLIKTAFSNSDEFGSSAFDMFRENRLTIANRLATQRGIDLSIPANIDADGYPVGYGKSSQQVLLPSFLAAYTGANASDVSLGMFRSTPIPNWNVKYNGLMRYKFFKEKFKRFSLQHNYKASYTINTFRSSFDYNQNPNGKDIGGNYYAQTIVGNVNLVEQFNPLIRVDFETKSSFKLLMEMKKDRALSLSFDNNLLTEVKGIEYVIGTGYRFKDVIFSTQLADSPTGIIKSDINLKIDFSYRNNKTIVRYLDYNNNQLGGGQNIWSAKLTADYSFSKNLTAIFYYDHSFSKAVISTSFPLTNIRGGFTLRYNFGN